MCVLWSGWSDSARVISCDPSGGSIHHGSSDVQIWWHQSDLTHQSVLGGMHDYIWRLGLRPDTFVKNWNAPPTKSATRSWFHDHLLVPTGRIGPEGSAEIRGGSEGRAVSFLFFFKGCLVPKKILQYSSHRIIGHMHGTLNAVEKINKNIIQLITTRWIF